MTLTFWLSIAFVAYVYAGYPALLQAWAVRRARRRPGADADGPTRLPGVSIVIAARNESARLGARLDNLRSLDYPAARRQIIVVSDGSTDGTADVVARFRPFVELVEVSHGGKALALNAGVARARFDIVVFADARQTFAPDALRRLVAPFADPAIGGVSGELLLDCESALFANRRDRKRRRRPASAREASERRTNGDRRLGFESTIGDGVGL
jgi:biofilm PGA synthesis N-glycosyltransferase PgaC